MKLVLSVILLVGLYSCKKGQGDFVLKGTITDQTFSTHHSGAVAYLYKVPVGTTQQILLGSMTIGSNGAYQFSFPRDKMEKFVLKVDKEGYFTIHENIYFSSLTLEEDNVRNFSTTAKSWIKIRIKNEAPVFSDYFQYIKQQGKAGCSECCPTDQKTFYGAVDTTIYCINDGNTTYSLHYFGTGMSTAVIDGVQTTAFDTTEFVINY